MADQLRDKLVDGVVLRGLGPWRRRSSWWSPSRSRSPYAAFKAGDIVKQVAQVVGGRVGVARHGAGVRKPDVGRLDEAIERFYALLT